MLVPGALQVLGDQPVDQPLVAVAWFELRVRLEVGIPGLLKALFHGTFPIQYGMQEDVEEA